MKRKTGFIPKEEEYNVMSNIPQEPLIERIIRILERYVLGDRQEECAEKIIREFQSSDVTKEQNEKDLHSRLQNGRDYLMGVNQKKVVVEDALEAFGFRRSGLEH